MILGFFIIPKIFDAETSALSQETWILKDYTAMTSFQSLLTVRVDKMIKKNMVKLISSKACFSFWYVSAYPSKLPSFLCFLSAIM